MPSSNNSRDKIDEIKSRLDIVAVIDQDIGLHHKNGSKYVGTVGTPGKTGESLIVDRSLQVFYDFKNGIGGDVLDWIGYNAGCIDPRGADFPDVLRMATDMAGVELEELTSEELDAAKEKADIHNLYTKAVEIYHGNLKERPHLYEYISGKWGITPETIDRLKIGYATTDRNLEDLDKAILRKSGLVYVNGEIISGEVFLGRIIFPYWKNGKVVYLIGRETEETPEAERFKGMKYKKLLVHKDGREYVSPSVQNSYFYGEDSLRGADYCVITEGVADCIAMLQANFPCVSPVTVQFRDKDYPKLISLIKGLKKVYTCNDNEVNKAGLRGALNTAETLEGIGIEAHIIELPKPEGTDKIDIADYMKDHNPQDFKGLMNSSLRLWTYKLKQQVINKNSTSLERLRAYKDFISNDLRGMKPEEWIVFVKNEVTKEYGLKLSDVRQSIAEVFRTLIDKSKEKGDEPSAFRISRFNLDTAAGRGEAYRVLTNDFLKTYDPVITFADNGEIRIYKDGVYSNLEGSAELKINNYITEDLAFQKYSTCLSPNHVENIIKMIKAKTHVSRSEVDKDPFKLAVKNGILNVRTGELSPFNPDVYFVSKIDVEYNPSIKPVPEFVEYLKTTFKGVEWQIPVIQEITGYCLYRAYPYEYLVFFTGDGRNGKGLFFQLLGRLVGKHNISSISLDEIVRKPSEFTLCDLFGKMINLCGEIGKGRISETRDIKMLTGKDDCRARFPYQRGFTFKNHAKMIFSMNEPPEIEDFTTGMRNRIKIYDFPNQFITGKNAINDLEDKLTTPEALTGMLNWALEGLHRLLKNNGRLSDPRSAAQMGVVYEKKSRPMYYFVRDCIEPNPMGMVLREKLEEAYLNYAKQSNLPTLSKEKIREKLIDECRAVGINIQLKQVYKSQLESSDQESKTVSSRPRVYIGIKVLEPEPEQENIAEYTCNKELEKIVDLGISDSARDNRVDSSNICKHETPKAFQATLV